MYHRIKEEPSDEVEDNYKREVNGYPLQFQCKEESELHLETAIVSSSVGDKIKVEYCYIDDGYNCNIIASQEDMPNNSAAITPTQNKSFSNSELQCLTENTAEAASPQLGGCRHGLDSETTYMSSSANCNAAFRHLTDDRRFLCDYCEASFARKGDLSLHIRIHTGEKQFSCDYCQVSFAHKSNLTQHTRIHTGEKPFHCDYCQASFTRKRNLNQHIRIHTGEKPFSCEYCQASFAVKSNLTRHMFIHTGEKPYDCDKCASSFARKGDLLRHIRTHTGEKPSACSSCEASFARKEYLSQHLRTHTGERPFVCDFENCGAAYVSRSGLMYHKAKHNN